jgi:L-amino acid N-acyltransferase YncA
MRPDDWPQVRAVYLDGLATGHATFESEAPAWDAWDQGHLPHSRLVVYEGATVAGWAALSPVSRRAVYAGVAEVSVYVGSAHRGKGVGRALLEELITSSEANGLWTLQAGIFPENTASVALHEACGFRVVGRREHLGRMHGLWRDVLLLERRSSTVGR